MGDSIAVLPVIHGSGQFALTVRRWLLEHDFDCVALPLPESYRESVEASVLDLPRPSIVIQPAMPQFDGVGQWQPSSGDADDVDTDVPLVSYVPVDPCQPVIMAIRAAMGEHVPRAYIDLETDPSG